MNGSTAARWTSDQHDRIAAAGELRVASLRCEGIVRKAITISSCDPVPRLDGEMREMVIDPAIQED